MFVACDPPVQEHKVPVSDPVPEQFVKANQYSQRRHQDHISAFIERVGWVASVTPSGLWIVVNDQGDGAGITDGSRVTYAYKSTLLDGTDCYEASEDDPKSVVIGQGGIESGVEEGLRKLQAGSEAIFLIPPHLAHGNFGDRDKIPGNSVLIYRVKILSVL
jgi:FKBP-type peptidyl-prolyl cis-trans isomerase